MHNGTFVEAFVGRRQFTVRFVDRARTAVLGNKSQFSGVEEEAAPMFSSHDLTIEAKASILIRRKDLFFIMFACTPSRQIPLARDDNEPERKSDDNFRN
jgi:hypothetical protein